VPSVTALTKNVLASIVISFGSRPNTSGKLKAIDASTTTGTVRPIDASQEPIARFMLLCNRSARAARTAADVSGSKTSAAITIPTTVLGALAASTACSIVGESFR
jgi:hypothetical protein